MDHLIFEEGWRLNINSRNHWRKNKSSRVNDWEKEILQNQCSKKKCPKLGKNILCCTLTGKKHYTLNDCPWGEHNYLFCFPRISMFSQDEVEGNIWIQGKQSRCFQREQSLSALLYSISKINHNYLNIKR